MCPSNPFIHFPRLFRPHKSFYLVSIPPPIHLCLCLIRTQNSLVSLQTFPFPFSYRFTTNSISPVSRNLNFSALFLRKPCPSALQTPFLLQLSRDPSLDLAHRAQYLVPRLSRCQARQTISRRKLQIHTHPVRQKAHSLNQLRICPRNCFHMDVTVKSMDAPKAVQGLIQQFHRVIRCLQHTGT